MAGKMSRFWTEHRDSLERLAAEGLTDKQIAELIPVQTVSQVTTARQRFGIPSGEAARDGHYAAAEPKPFHIEPLPSKARSAGEVIAARKSEFGRVAEAKRARRLMDVQIGVDGPFAVAHFGDPHVDDPGCDIALLEDHVRVVNRTPAMFAGNVGDVTNNWVGRLAHLHGKQGTTAEEAWVLAEWLIRSMNWMYLVGGNHDAWAGDGDPLKWIARQHGSLLEPNGVRLNLVTPSARSFRINARHDFPGRSMYNVAHGPARAAMTGWRDHALTCGHTHASGLSVLKDPASGLISYAIRVASYKVYDEYASEKGFPDQNIFVCPTTIFNPAHADNDNRAVMLVLNPEDAADYLTFLRARKSGMDSGRPKMAA